MPHEQPDPTRYADAVADWQEPRLWELVGRTPLIRLPVPARAGSGESSLLLKAEWLNPGGSVKDRPAREIAAAEPDRYWYADQYGHPANPHAHYRTTGPEIWRDTYGRITHLVAGVGTSGTLMGAGRFLKEQRPDVRLIAVEPEGPFHGLEGLKHMATAIVPTIYDPSGIDETVFVVTEEAESMVRALGREEGLFVGWSTGAALVAAEQVLLREATATGESPVVVVIAPDGGTRYLSESRRLFGT